MEGSRVWGKSPACRVSDEAIVTGSGSCRASILFSCGKAVEAVIAGGDCEMMTLFADVRWESGASGGTAAREATSSDCDTTGFTDEAPVSCEAGEPTIQPISIEVVDALFSTNGEHHVF